MELFPLLIGFLFLVAAGSTAGDGKLTLPINSQQGKLSTELLMRYTRLVDGLRAAGVSAVPADEVDQPFFSVQGRMIQVSGQDVQVFQYAHVVAASEQAVLVSPDGSAVGTSKLHWIGAPHFYKKGLLLVLYVGDDAKVQKTLEAVLGRQFAGK